MTGFLDFRFLSGTSRAQRESGQGLGSRLAPASGLVPSSLAVPPLPGFCL